MTPCLDSGASFSLLVEPMNRLTRRFWSRTSGPGSRPRGGHSAMLLVAWAVGLFGANTLPVQAADLIPTHLRCEYLSDPVGIDETAPRLSWEVEAASLGRGRHQTAYQILVASTGPALARDQGDLWDSGQVATNATLGIVYAGRPLPSRQACFWKVRVWDQNRQVSPWSKPVTWTMGLLQPEDWQAQWISFKDETPLHTDREHLFLPPARHYRQEFQVAKPLARATLFASALGLFEFHLNGQRAGSALFTPGWSDYRQRAYYRTVDVTSLLQPGPNAIGAIVADGWYSGYLGYGLLVGYGPNQVGRYFYGKTPALLAQLEIEYTDGTRESIATNPSWKVSDQGPIREADMLMGETFDARLEKPAWAKAGFPDDSWASAIRAEDNGSTRAVYSDPGGAREVELGFLAPKRLQAYPGPPIQIIEERPPTRMMEPRPGVYLFDFGQNFSGVVRLKVQGPAGTRVQIRYGEMLHPDGRLMTENLRRARATDTYTLRGDPAGETWTPRFTYHGFQYAELTGLPEKPGLDTLTGLVIHSATPLTSDFECSDAVINRLFQNIVWTQRANFFEIPTDCPQRDERFGWMGDAQIYARTATYNADVAAFFTKWLDDVEEAQRRFGAYPDYAPYPMQHGASGKSFGTAWMDAGIICPWTLYQAYGDTRVIARHYDSMTRFMEFRQAVSPEHLGVSIGNPWGDWLNLNEPTPVEYIDVCYYAYTSRLMADMANAIGRVWDAQRYQKLFVRIQSAFQKTYLHPDGTLKVDSQTAYVLALAFDLLPQELAQSAADHLADMIAANDCRMATGFLGTKALLPVLSANGHHDLAVRLFQSRRFPSWGYEVVNGATTVWERWDSYTKEDGFGRHNAAMNSFSHYAFGAVCEWMFRSLAGIDTDGPGYENILIRPGPPSAEGNPEHSPIDRVRATYRSARGPIRVAWQRSETEFVLELDIPANTTATVHLPATAADQITEGGQMLGAAPDVRCLRLEKGRAILAVDSGHYRFVSAF